MRNFRVLIPDLHVEHAAKCFFRLVYTRIFIHNYRTTLFYHKNNNVGLYEYKVEGSGCGFNRNRGLAETDS